MSEVAVAHKMVHDGVSSAMATENGKLVGIVYRLDLYAAVLASKPTNLEDLLECVVSERPRALQAWEWRATREKTRVLKRYLGP